MNSLRMTAHSKSSSELMDIDSRALDFRTPLMRRRESPGDATNWICASEGSASNGAGAPLSRSHAHRRGASRGGPATRATKSTHASLAGGSCRRRAARPRGRAREPRAPAAQARGAARRLPPPPHMGQATPEHGALLIKQCADAERIAGVCAHRIRRSARCPALPLGEFLGRCGTVAK